MISNFRFRRCERTNKYRDYAGQLHGHRVFQNATGSTSLSDEYRNHSPIPRRLAVL